MDLSRSSNSHRPLYCGGGEILLESLGDMGKVRTFVVLLRRESLFQRYQVSVSLNQAPDYFFKVSREENWSYSGMAGMSSMSTRAFTGWRSLLRAPRSISLRDVLMML